MVTWGQNTVHTFGAPATAAPTAFGTPAGAPPGTPTTTPTGTTVGGGLFGTPAQAPTTSTGLFGSPAPAPTTSTGLFGAPAPSTGTSLFGTPSAAPAAAGGSLFGTPSTGGLFGSTPAPPSTTASSYFGGYGAPAPATTTTTTSLFGGSTTSLFGTPTPAAAPPSAYGATAQPPIPAQAALQAHMDASARQEAERVRLALESLHASYTGTAVTDNTNNNNNQKSKFVAIVYNDMTKEQRQLQWVHGIGTTNADSSHDGQLQLLAPPRPPQVTEAEWKKAVVNNPDPKNYMPIALVGAVALQGRVSWQQERAKELAECAATLQKSHETLQDRSQHVSQDLQQLNRKHASLRKRLLDVMRRVELVRCMNLQIQPDELKAISRLVALYKQVEAARTILVPLQENLRSNTTTRTQYNTSTAQNNLLPDKAQLFSVLKQHREAIEKLTISAKTDLRDIDLLHQRLGGPTATSSTVNRTR